MPQESEDVATRSGEPQRPLKSNEAVEDPMVTPQNRQPFSPFLDSTDKNTRLVKTLPDWDDIDKDELGGEAGRDYNDTGSEEDGVDADDFMSSKEPQYFLCAGCNRGFKKSNSLARHILSSKHPGERLFQCKCSRRFSTLEDLLQHFKIIHLSMAPSDNLFYAAGAQFQEPFSLGDWISPIARPSKPDAGTSESLLVGPGTSTSMLSLSSHRPVLPSNPDTPTPIPRDRLFGAVDPLGHVGAFDDPYLSPANKPTHEVTRRWSVTWELMQCIRDELDQDTHLSPVLTVTGIASRAWAVACGEYVKATWGHLGATLLDSLEMALLGRSSPVERCHFAHVSLESETKGLPVIVTYRGTIREVRVVERFLSWITATFRRSQPGKLMLSPLYVAYDIGAKDGTKTQTDQIRMLSLHPVVSDDSQGTCWHHLFPSTVMAHSGFPVSLPLGVNGLRIPFDIMLELANMIYHVNLGDADDDDYGIYFKGLSTMLYPTAHFVETNIIQWHLVTDTESLGLGRDCSPDDIPGSGWARIRDFETLRCATAILGYCGDVKIQLGTETRREQYRDFKFSLTSVEMPPPEASIGTVTAGISAMGFGTAQIGGALKYRKGLADALSSAQEITYRDILESAAKEPVILFETESENERGWLVPRLSVILDLLNYWAIKNGDTGTRYAQPLSDGGSAAKAVLQDREYANRVFIEPILEGEPRLRVGDAVKLIYSRMRSRESVSTLSERGAKGTVELGRDGLLGWDLKELIEQGMMPKRRRVNLHKTDIDQDIKVTPCWLPLARTIPVYLGQGLGQLIVPACPRDVCEKWQRVPGGFLNNYFIASVRCLVAISEFYGHKDCCVVLDDLIWDFTDEFIFEVCKRSTDKLCTAHGERRVQVLRMTSQTHTCVRTYRDGEYYPRIPLDGAVVFGNKRGLRLSTLQALDDVRRIR